MAVYKIRWSGLSQLNYLPGDIFKVSVPTFRSATSVMHIISENNTGGVTNFQKFQRFSGTELKDLPCSSTLFFHRDQHKAITWLRQTDSHGVIMNPTLYIAEQGDWSSVDTVYTEDSLYRRLRALYRIHSALSIVYYFQPPPSSL
jgi:hypothetical protein